MHKVKLATKITKEFNSKPEKQFHTIITFLTFGSHEILSSEGAQQGDPLGSLEFCEAIHLCSVFCEAIQAHDALVIFKNIHTGTGIS